jgi:hypothetical protein
MKSGDAWLVVQAGWLDEGSGPVEQPIPYGSMPRLALAWVSSYAPQKTREIPIGKSANRFLQLMGLSSGGRHIQNVARTNARAGRLPLAARI